MVESAYRASDPDDAEQQEFPRIVQADETLVSSAHQAVEQVYAEKSGEAYSQNVLSASDGSQNVIARNRLRKLRDYVAKTDRVLEIGVGLGTNLRHLECREKVGFDIGDYGKDTCEAYGIEFVGDLTQLGQRKFSTVILHHVIEHVPDPLAMLERANGLLEEGGKILVFVPNDVWRRERKYRQGDPNHHLYSWSPLTLGNLVESAGLRIIDIKTQPFGYERALAPLARVNDFVYRAALFFLRLVRPVSEIFVCAKTRHASKARKQ